MISGYNVISTTLEMIMHEADYLSLRESLRERAKRDDLDVEFIRRFIVALAHDVDEEVGREQSVCEVGVVRAGTFVKDEFDSTKGAVNFAVRVLFHNENKQVLFSPTVEFVAKIEDSSTIAVFFGSTGVVRIPSTIATTPEGRRSALFVLNEEVKKSVKAVLSTNH